MTVVNRPRGGPLGASGLRTPSQRYVCVYSSLSMKFTVIPIACRFTEQPLSAQVFTNH